MTDRLRTAVRGVLILGMAASVVANILHAQPTLVARAIGAWSPLALLLTIELVARVPVVRPRLAWPRRAATTAIAGIAGWVSYWHTVAVCERFGESPASAHLIPFSVDGLIVVASVCLVEIGTTPVTAGHTTAIPPTDHGEMSAHTPVRNTPVEIVPTTPEHDRTAPVQAWNVRETPLTEIIPGSDGQTPAHDLPDGQTSCPPDGHRGAKRVAVAALLAAIPADDPRSAAQLARDLAPQVGLSVSTARKYIAALSK
ncbi:DUF2637 domain-containing protein, partial [Frankia sp. CiP3]|uniref:DUF2637 domain-containing protein n=1 Tax=Frankia sp. CiP3 TaxID=2880971 RepID=UPI001EF48621